MTTHLQDLQKKAAQLNINLEPEELALFDAFLKELAAFNEHTNLVSRADASTVINDHILDSLSLIPILRRLNSKESAKLIDIGSGAGFPGTILAMSAPDINITLVESTNKKCNFLSLCRKALALEDNLTVLNERAEELAHVPEFREQFDFATARAVGTLDLILELCLPYLKTGGYLLAQKSKGQLPEETKQAEAALKILGGKITETIENQISGRDHAIVVIEKIASTSKRYPRMYSKIKQQKLTR